MVRKDHTGEWPAVTDDITKREWVGAKVAAIIVAGFIALHLLMPSTSEAATRACVVDRATVQGERADAHQRQMISRVHDRADRRWRASRKVQLAAGTTIIVESWARNLRYGDSSSLGLFQILDIHGSAAQRTNPEWSTDWFTPKAKNIEHHLPHLTVGQTAQRVQRSAHPARYAEWVGEARRNYIRWLVACR